MTTTAPTPTDQRIAEFPNPTCRSAHLWEQLATARAATRAVALYGHTSDVFVADNGHLVRIEEYLAHFSAANGATLLVCDRGRRIRCVMPPGVPAAGPPIDVTATDPAALVDQVIRDLSTREAPTTILVDWVCQALAADDGELLRTLTEVPGTPELTGRGHQLIVVFRTGDPPRQLTALPGWAVVEVGLPDVAERTYILARAHARTPVPLQPDLDVPGVATTLGGTDADGLLRLANEARRRRPLTVERLIEVKATEIARTAAGTLEVARGPAPNGLAGMPALRYHVESSLTAGVPIGNLLLAGVPGVGKTYSFRWLAQRLGLPPVRFGQLRGGIVGQTEERFAQARRALRGNAPGVVFIDEADQTGFGRRRVNLDSGVSDRLRAGMLELLNDAEEDGILYVLATNDPAGIDVAGLDRLTVLPALHPSAQESFEILTLAAQRAGWSIDEDGATALLTQHDQLLTGRQLVRLLQWAMRYSALAGHPGQVTAADLREAIADSIDVVDRSSHEYMALSALCLAGSKSALPWVAAKRLGEPSELPPYLVPFVASSGEIDMARLHARLSELEQAGHGFVR